MWGNVCVYGWASRSWQKSLLAGFDSNRTGRREAAGPDFPSDDLDGQAVRIFISTATSDEWLLTDAVENSQYLIFILCDVLPVNGFRREWLPWDKH